MHGTTKTLRCIFIVPSGHHHSSVFLLLSLGGPVQMCLVLGWGGAGRVPVMLHEVVSCSRFNPEPWAPRGRFAQPAHSHHFRSHSTDLSTRGLPRYVPTALQHGLVWSVYLFLAAPPLVPPMVVSNLVTATS